MVCCNPKRVPVLLLPVLATMLLLLSACENDLQQIKQISAMRSSQPIDTTRGVDVIYSDSAFVKGRLITPLLIKYSVEKPYDVMPDGIKVIFFDAKGKEMANIVADSAVQLENESITKFYKNVVATNTKGETFKSEELIWDQPKKIIYSSKRVDMNSPERGFMSGVDFHSDDKLEEPQWRGATGEGDVPADQM